jgi:putative ABC transport system permease protein
MSAFTAEHRTKEIGIRKAMGASRTDILRLLLWQFTKPVLWANALAWPPAYFMMRRWLEGFAYHIDLEPWMFLAASALALAIAVITVTGHALLVARSPAGGGIALRIGEDTPCSATTSPPRCVIWCETDLAPLIKLDIPFVEAVARLAPEDVSLRHAGVEANEHIYWTDRTVFETLSLPVFAGDPKIALDRPESIVLTRSMARKYFGRDDAVGETLEINRQHPMTVTAVLEDLPPNTHFDAAIMASARAAASPLARPGDNAGVATYSYTRLSPGHTVYEFQRALADLVERHANPSFTLPAGDRVDLRPVPIARVHLSAQPSLANTFIMKSRGTPAIIASVSVIGVLILLVACINFVNLMTAWAARRAAEVGVRKVSGAKRRDLIIQFIGEALFYVGFSAVVAIGLAERLSPKLQVFLQRGAAFPYWHEPAFVCGIIGFALVLGVLAGAYPALVLSAFKPATVLKTNTVRSSGSGVLRRLLATFQFAVLIGLIVATATIYAQIHFALNEGMRIDKDQTLLISSSCQGPFPEQVRAVTGVAAVVCSHIHTLDRGGGRLSSATLPDGSKILVTKSMVAPGFFEFYGLRPLAGRFLSAARGDEMPFFAEPAQRKPPAVIVINEAALRAFGFQSAAAAIGQELPTNFGDPSTKATVVGVVADFSLDSIGSVVGPIFYFSDASFYGVLNVKLNGYDIPETLASIDRLWKEFGEPRPIVRSFLDQQIEDLHKDLTRQGQVFAAFAGVAVFIAGLGLFGLAAFTAERRTKEIGVRKAMGASQTDVLRLLVWEFAKPVLWANVIAWPIGYFAMHRWLEGFPHHIDLEPWVFLGASAIALLIAILTVAGHALLVARAEPVAALRYE